MCLDRVDEELKVKRTAYRIVRKINGQYYPLYSFLSLIDREKLTPKPLPTNQWLDAADWKPPYLSVFPPLGYERGWHCYNSLRKAKGPPALLNCAFLKVALKNCTASGVQWGCRCTVARRIKILEEVK